MSNIEPIATAFVEIRPDPASAATFRTQLRTMLEEAIGGKPFPIPVIAELLPFKAAIQAQLRDTSFVVPVTPVINEAALGKFEAQLRTATEGLAVPVTVIPAAVAPTAAAAAAAVPSVAATGAAAATVAEQKLASIETARVAAINAVNEALAQDISEEDQLIVLKRASTQLTNAQRAAEAGLADAIVRKDVARAADIREAQGQIASEKELIATLAEERAALITARPAAVTGAVVPPAAVAGAAAEGEIADVAAGATVRLTEAEKARNALLTSSATVQSLYDATLQQGISAEILAGRVAQARTAVYTAIRQATRIASSAGEQYTATVRTQAAADLEDLRVLEQKIAVQANAAKATIEGANAARLATSATGEQASVQERLAIIQEQGLAATIASSGAARAQSDANLLVADARRVRNSVERLSIGEEAVLTEEDLKLAEADLALAIQIRGLIPLQTKLNEIETAGIGTTTSLARVKAELSAANRLVGPAQRAVTAAEDSEIPVAEALAAALQQLVLARQEEAVAAVDQAAADAKAAETQAGIIRGFGARAGTAAGLRGATLAASAPFLIGTAAATSLFLAAKASAEFQKSLLEIQQVSGATSSQIGQISTVAKDLGKSLKLPQISAVESAQAIDILTHSGLNLVNAANAARGALILTAGGQISLADATKATVEVLRAFRLQATDSVEVADTLTNAANATHASMTEVVAAFDAVGPVASRSGLSLQSTVTLLVQLVEGGTDASRAASQLRQSLLRLEAPSATAQKAFKKLLLSEADLVDAQGNVRPDAFVILGKALQDLDKRQGLSAKSAAILNRQLLAQIFSARAVAGALILTGQGAAGFQKAQEEVNKTGTAFLRAQVEAKTFSGQVQILKANLSDLALQVGPTLLTGFSQLVRALSLTATLISDVARVSGDAAGHVDDFLGQMFAIPGVSEKTNKGLGDLVKGIAITGFKIADFADPLVAFPALIKGLNAIDPPAKLVQTDSELIGSSIAKVADAAKKAGVLGIGPFIQFLKQLSFSLATAGPKGEEAAKVINEFIATIQKTGKIPVNIALQIEAAIDQANADDQVKKLREVMRDSFEHAPPINVTPTVHVTKINLTGLQNAVKAAQNQIDIQTIAAGGTLTPQAQLAIDKQVEAAQRAVVAVAERSAQRRGRKSTPTLAAARAALAATLRDEAAQRDAIASDAKSAAEKVKTAQDKADQAIIDQFDTRTQDIQNRLTIASARDQLKKELKLNQELLRRYHEERRTMLDRIKDTKTRAQFLQQIKAGIAQSQATIIGLQKQIAQAQRDAFQTKIIDILDLRIQIADVNGQTRLEENLLRQEIAQFEKQLKRLKHRQAKLKDILQLELQIAEAKKKLRDLEKSEANKDKIAQQEFAFLQTQQGFATNLFSNLIPASFTGLVGGSSANVPGVGPPRQVPGGFEQPRGARTPANALINAGALSGAQERGFSKGDVNRLLHLTQRLVEEVARLNRAGDHQAARHTRRRDSVGIDHLST